MANLLEQLSQGMRVAGAALSPQAFQAEANQRERAQILQAREQEQFNALRARRTEMIAELTANAVREGSMSPDKAQVVAQHYGFELPPLGPSVQTQKAQGEMQMQAEADTLRKQIDARIASKYAPPTPQGTGTGMTIGPDGKAMLDPVVVDSPENFPETETERAMLYQQTGNPLLMAESRKILADLRAEERAGKQAETPLAKLIRERDALPQESPLRARYDQAIAKETGGEQKGQIIDLGDKMIVVDPTKIGDVFTKGLSPKDAAKGPETLNQKEIAEIESKLRDDFWQQVGKEFSAARDAHDRIQAAAANPSAAGDLALIYNYMRLLDPTSVVRESEFQVAAATGAFGERVKSAIQKALTGERLSDAIRNDFVNRADSLYERADRNYKNSSGRFRAIAQRSGANPDNVLPQITSSGIKSAVPNKPPAQSGEGWSIREKK